MCVRALEGLDAELSETDDQDRPLTFGKVAVAAVVGNEDGAHHIGAILSNASTTSGSPSPPGASPSGKAKQAGTVRFGTDPASSALDVHCKAHDLDNLYVVDGSFMPSIGAVNPTLTIIANAIRVAEHVAARLA